MPNRSTDSLFQLIKSLEKSEKRNFKLYATRNTSGEALKSVLLFDAMEKMPEYDEEQLLKKYPVLKKTQLSNMKAHLYRQILSSLRLLNNQENIDLLLHEQMDYARILYNKGLYLQSLRVLDKIKENARFHHQLTFLLQIIFFEKKIEALHITRSMQDRAERLATEVEEVQRRLAIISKLSNLSLQLYSWYIKNGHARNEKDAKDIAAYFAERLSVSTVQVTDFYARLYLYQSYTWYAFIQQDFLKYYRYTQKWVDLFTKEPHMIDIETAHYIKGLHNLLNAHFTLGNYQKFHEMLSVFEEFADSDLVVHNENNRIQVFVYLHTAKLNGHFMEGTFTSGIQLVPEIEKKLQEYMLYLDRHRVLVFYYKIASLYFGSGDYEKAIDYLNKIIHWKMDLRTDLQCYARLLHLIAHYELGNFDILEYLIKSVYRFMAKMENLSRVEEEIFRFLPRAIKISPRKLQPEFEKLAAKLKALQGNPFETRAFMYLDILSWLESKIKNVPVQDIIREKFLGSGEKEPL